MINARRYKIIARPTESALSVAQVRAHLKLDEDWTHEDEYLSELIEAATDWCEQYTNRALLTQTVVISYDFFPLKTKKNPFRSFFLFRSPLQSIVSISYIDENGESQDWSEDEYYIDTIHEPARITPKNAIVPKHTIVPGSIKIEGRFGFTKQSDIPPSLKRAMLHYIAALYEDRENPPHEKITAAERLANQYRVIDL